ncbi:MAG TPA: efflux RND transporter permease subunit [Gemmataceae bacterium]|nr:efflux RND transporter permease subunit [Gemmataceae bacterium]
MQKLIELALNNSRAVTVAMLSIVILGVISLLSVPMDVLPVYDRPAVQVLTFYSGMPSEEMAGTVTFPMERLTGQAAGMRRQESRSIIGVSIVRNYFQGNVDANGALTQINSLALGEIPNLPPGTLPPVVLPYDPTASVPVCLVAVDSPSAGEAVLYDVGRYEVRNMIMNSPGANAPVVYGGKIRAVLAEVDPTKLEARGLSLRDVLDAIEKYNLFLPTGDANFGQRDYAIDSNSMFQKPEHMEDIPLRTQPGSVDFLGDVAKTRDTHLIQMSAVRVNGRREVYIPVYRQHGASTLQVVDDVKAALPGIQSRLSRPDVRLHMVMDQSVYVRQSIRSLATEGVLGAVLCSFVILIFLGHWRMTVIAMLLIPLAVFVAIAGLYALGQSINVMTLAGLALAIGPLVDIAIVCLENTHRHLQMGASPRQAAFAGAGEVVLPELVATGATLLVLAPLALMPGRGQFLFRPLALAVALAMIASFLLAMTFVPSRSANWLKTHVDRPGGTWLHRVFERVQGGIGWGIQWYERQLERVLRRRRTVVIAAAGALVLVVVLLTPIVRREFFPETDAGAFEIYVRANSGTRLTETEKHVTDVEDLVRQKLGSDLQIIVSELGVWADWSAAYTPNSGPMDAVVKVQLVGNRRHSAQHYAQILRATMAQDNRFATLDVAFNTGGTIRSALNEGRPTPIDLRLEGKDMNKSRTVAERLRDAVAKIPGVVDARIVQRLDYPAYVVEVDRAKARRLGLTQKEVMENVVAALKSTIQYNKKNFWFDPITHNQYYVGVQYPERDIQSLETLLNVSVTSPTQEKPIPLSNLVSLRPSTMATEVTHNNLQTTVDLTMNVEGRDLGHVADDIKHVVNQFAKPTGSAAWTPYDPEAHTGDANPKLLEGATLTLTGEFQHMEETFVNFGIGMLLAVVFIYFLMVVLLDSYLIPLVILSAAPIGLVGVLPVLYVTGTAINIQSLLGVIFMIGIVVSNTVLMVDFAQNLRARENLSPTDAIRKAASIRVRPVVMTALAALFALIPMALAVERGSEANAPLGRAVIGGLIAGLVTTLVVVPALYALVVRDKPAAATLANH